MDQKKPAPDLHVFLDSRSRELFAAAASLLNNPPRLAAAGGLLWRFGFETEAGSPSSRAFFGALPAIDDGQRNFHSMIHPPWTAPPAGMLAGTVGGSGHWMVLLMLGSADWNDASRAQAAETLRTFWRLLGQAGFQGSAELDDAGREFFIEAGLSAGQDTMADVISWLERQTEQ